MDYKGIKFEYREWLTWNGESASAYYCSDKRLLSGLEMKEFGANSLSEMQSAITYYIRDKDILLEQQVRNEAAAADFYDNLNYKGD